jgi:glucose-6-phosphate 1-dehydrogenase
MRGDHNLFVRNDELVAAWHIFTPILHQLENEKIKPIIYKFGSRGPAEADAMLYDHGYVRPKNYAWSPRAEQSGK